MYTGQLEQLARQRIAELPAKTTATRPAGQRRQRTQTRADAARSSRGSSGGSLRTSTGWALVSIGLRLAQSGSH
jgi:hypothetical protein